MTQRSLVLCGCKTNCAAELMYDTIIGPEPDPREPVSPKGGRPIAIECTSTAYCKNSWAGPAQVRGFAPCQADW